MKKILKCLIALSCVITLLTFTVNCESSNELESNKICGKYNEDIECIKNNFAALYKNNYDIFWKILLSETKLVKESLGHEKIKSFLELPYHIKGNAEVGEFFGETMEGLFLSRPNDVLDAMMNLNKKFLKPLIFYFHNPIITEGEEINRKLSQLKSKPKYSAFIEKYF